MVNVPVGRVIVDDTDSAIQYSGPWFADTSGSQDNSGNYGPAYESTLHGTTFNASLSYIFSGTHVVVYGSNYLRNDSGVLDPKWECFVDHISIGATTPFQFPENNWLFCNQDTLVDGSHVLTVNATVLKAQTFWFDYIEYTPSHSVPLDNTTVLVENSDPQVQSAYGSGWKALGGTANSTSQTNSVFTFNFTGVSLSWYGFIPTEFPHTATTGTYSVDGKTPVGFLLKGLPTNSDTIYNQKFFETETLEQGNHQIIVLFQGSGQTTPLTLDYLTVKNGIITNSSSTTNPTDAPSQGENQQHHKGSGGFIALGVVLAAVIILAIVAGFWYIRRRRRNNALNEKGPSDPTDNLAPHPFVYSPVPPLPLETSVLDGYTSKTNPAYPQYASGTSRNAGLGHSQMPSISATDASQPMSVDPPSTGRPSTTFSSNVNTTGHEPHSGPSSYVIGGAAQAGAHNGTTYTSSSSVDSSTRSEKERREAEAISAALRPPRRNDGGLQPSTNSDGTSGYVMHQDSGIRLAPPVTTEHIEEIPPQYTAG